ncbi:cupin domain-containing protein [Algoriphagus namhaensis]
MNVPERIDYLVKKLDLQPHPEGGFFKETYRSNERLSTHFGERHLMTSIFFLLTSAHVSRFHRIKSDEQWYFHEGSPLTVHTLDDLGHSKFTLGPVAEGQNPYFLVKRNTIFGSTVEEKDAYCLVSCAVAPGFDFDDFELFTAESLLKDFPQEKEIIHRLT